MVSRIVMRLLEWKVSEDRRVSIAKDLEFQDNEG